MAVPANETFYDTVTETQFSQEFNVISPDNKPVTWLLGAFGLWDTYFFPAPFSNFDINANSTVTGPISSVNSVLATSGVPAGARKD